MCDEQISVDGKATESSSPSVIRWNRQRGRNQLQDCPYRRWPENSEPLSYFDQHQMKIRPSMSSFPYVPSPKTCPGTKVRRPSLSPLSLPPPIGCPIQFRMGNTFGQVPDPVEAETDVIKGTGQVDINNTNAGNNASSRTSSATPVEAPLQTTPNKPPVPPYPLGEGFPEIEWSSGDMNNNKMIELLDRGVFVPKPKSLTSPGILGKSASENVRMLAQQVEESRRRTQELKRMNSKNTTAQVSGESGFAVSTPNSFFNRMEKENQMCSVHPLQMQCSPKAGSNFVQGPPAESNKCEVNTEADTVHTTPALNQINSSYSESPERMSLDVDPRLIPQQGRNSKIREAGPALADSPMSWASSVRQPRSLSTLPTILPITALPGISPIMTKGKVPELMNCKLPSASTPQLDIYDQNHNENIKQKQHPRKILKLMQDDGPAFSKGKGGMYPTHDKNSILTPWRGMGPAEKERATFNAQFVPDGCSSESSPVTSPQRKVIHRLTPDTSCHASSMCAPSEQSYNSSYSFDTSQASPLNVTETKRKVEKKAESEGIAGSAREEGELVYDWFEDKPVTKENVISPPRAETSPGDKAVEQPQAVETEYGGAYNPSAYYDRVNHNRFQRLQQVKTRLSSSSAGAAETDRDPLSCVRWTSWQEKFLQRYQSCQVPFIDTHCHLDFLYDRTGFAGTYQKYRTLNKDTFPHNYMGCVAVFCNPRTFNSSGGLWKDILMEHNVWGAIGCHPKCATDFTPMYEEEMIKMLQHEKVAAVGEIGLDFSGSFYKYHETQKNVFARQLKIALKVDKPIVIHSRDAEQECIAVLEETIPNTHQIHRHCFTGSWPEAEAWLTKFPNSFIGLTPLVTYKGNRSIGPREVAARIPLNRLLLETDAPYFVPRQIPRDEVQFSHPGMAITVAEEVAFLKGIPIDTVLEHCMFNTRMMYRLL